MKKSYPNRQPLHNPEFAPSDPCTPTVSDDGDIVRIANRYWTVEHDRRRGGGLTAIRFHHGSGENLLAQPLGARAGRYIRGQGYVEYLQSNCADATCEISEDDEGVRLDINTALLSADGSTLPIRCHHRYVYGGWGHVTVETTFVFEQEAALVELAPCSMHLTPKIDRFGVRHASSPDICPSDPTIFWHDVTATRTWRSARSGYLNLTPLYWCALRDELEGIEFHRGADSELWSRFAGLEPGHACVAHERTADNQHFLVRNELFNSVDIEAIPAGTYHLDFHLGLPFVKPREAARNTFFHGRTRATDWPDHEQIQAMSEAGVRLVRHHDDNTHRPKSWPDGLYPPYAPDDMHALDRMLSDMDAQGIRVTPYFSLKEWSSLSPDFAEHAAAWARQTVKHRAIDGLESCYGAYMCQRSGWVEHLKANIDTVLSNHTFAGLYFDHLWPRECRHPDHCDGHQHTDVDAMFQFMKWARKRVGSDGILFTHVSRCPCMIFENMSDLIIIGEGNLMCAPQPEGLEPEAVYVPITPRHSVDFVQTPNPDTRRLYHMTLLQEGIPPQLQIEAESKKHSDWLLGEFKRLTPYVTSPAYRHLTAREAPVACPDGVFACAFVKTDGEQSVIYAVNHHAHPTTARLHPEYLRNATFHDASCCIELEGSGTVETTLEATLNDGVEVPIDAHACSLIRITHAVEPAAADCQKVLNHA